MHIPVLTTANFAAGLASAQLPVLVKFYSPGCDACMGSVPYIHQLAQQWAGRAHVAVVNVDADGPLAESQGVASIPCFGVYVRGKRVATEVGFDPATTPAKLSALLARAEQG